MQITEITVNAGRTLPHPTESYANLRPAVTLRAQLGPDDDARLATQHLQRMAEQLVEEHAVALVASIEERKITQQEADEIERLNHSLRAGQARLEDLTAKQEQRTARAASQPLLFDEPNASG